MLRRGVAVTMGTAALLGAGCGQIRRQARSLTGPDPADYTPLPANPEAATARRALNRAAFGPRPGEIARVAAIGTAAYLEEQLADRLDEDPAVAWRVGGLETQQAVQDAPDALSSLSDEQLLREMQQAALLRAVYSRHQLRETLADFWTNHFNIYALKGDGRILTPVNAEQALRPHLLGTFRDLLRASAFSPAMLGYLDNQENRRGVPNENYARELLELHTLGVHSGYTQRDIQEVARCFTGWTVQTGFRRGQLLFDAARHDEGMKLVPFLNLTLAPRGGQKDAETVLDRLALHPATARFVAGKLCRRYLGSAPEPVQAKAAAAYLRSGSDLRATLRPILLDGLLSAEAIRPALKRPLDLAVSALRALAADTDGGAPMQEHLARMGQPLYQWPMPDGFPEKASAWAGSLLPRWNFALALAANAIPGTTADLEAPLRAVGARTDAARRDALLEAVTGRPPDAPENRALRAQAQRHMDRARRDRCPNEIVMAETAALLLASPAYQWR